MQSNLQFQLLFVDLKLYVLIYTCFAIVTLSNTILSICNVQSLQSKCTFVLSLVLPKIEALTFNEVTTTSLRFSWTVINDGNDDEITCTTAYTKTKAMSSNETQSCERNTCTVGNLSINTEYRVFVTCNNSAGNSDTLFGTESTYGTGENGFSFGEIFYSLSLFFSKWCMWLEKKI